MDALDPAVALTLRGALALLFAAAAWHKLRDRAYFRAALGGYALLPAAALGPVALALPLVEALAAVGLVAGSAGGALLATVLLVAYTGAIAFNLARGRRDIDCGCGGPAAARQVLSGWLVARNAVLLLAATALLLPRAERALGAADLAICALALVAATLVYTAADQLAANWPRLQALRR